MSIDNETRNALAKMVTSCRRALMEDVKDQLRGNFGLHPDGTILPLDQLAHLTKDRIVAAQALRDLLDHFEAAEAGGAEKERNAAYERLVLEICFTAFNRLAALRLCEERGLVVECVRKGTASDGFRLFEKVSGGALGTRYEMYRIFLECLFDELAMDLGVLFDRGTPQSAIFPSERCLEEVLGLLNDEDLSWVWKDDETIGWIYQYFNPAEERKAMRDASQAPRNGRELAVRNQFFTPRYVVEFLTDNTLGRIWYEMRRGDTGLKEECRYLVRRSKEIFLAPGEKSPGESDDEMDLSQEELLKKPVYIEHRPKKDPRDLRVLDPACGSGHFLLYAFDLLERIYAEAWEDPESPKSEVTGQTLAQDFETLEELHRAVPKLIIEHNLHGIDIDPRAVQIAALAIWLRAQKTWKNLSIKTADRPRIARSNIVTAEPMPGEGDMRREFTAGLKPRVLGQIVDVVFEKMKLAGEAGSLLKIEEEIKDAIAEARKQWLEGPKHEQQFLFLGMASLGPKEQELSLDFKGITDEHFWEQAEDRILAALRDYAEQAENGHAISRRLFAEDAARGFAFIELCHKSYDVVLMNPPFGEGARNTQQYIKGKYSTSKSDIYSCFVKRATDICNGLLGAITNRIGLFTAYLEKWREDVFIRRSKLQLFVDLGYGVLDAALVEAAAYVIDCGARVVGQHSCFLNCLSDEHKDLQLSGAIDRVRLAEPHTSSSLVDLAEFESIPAYRMPYWVSKPWRQLFRSHPSFRDAWGRVLEGMTTGNNDRFVRLFWEVDPSELGFSERWASFAKGGEYAPYYSDLWLVIDWNGGKAGVSIAKGAILRNVSSYGKSGLTYSERTTSNLSVRVLPSGAILSTVGLGILLSDEKDKWTALGMWMSHPVQFLVEMCVGSGDTSKSGTAARHYRNGILEAIPFPRLSERSSKAVAEYAEHCFELLRNRDLYNETSRIFSRCPISNFSFSITENTKVLRREWLDAAVAVNEKSALIERHIVDAFSLREESIREMDAEMGIPPAKFPNNQVPLNRLHDFFGQGIEKAIDGLSNRMPGSRWLTKCGYYSDRFLEIAARVFECNPRAIANVLVDELSDFVLDCKDITFAVLQNIIGLVFGRWDFRIAIDPSLTPKLPDPFGLLPVCSPGMLVNPDGLPAEPGLIVSEEWLRERPDANTLPPEGLVTNPTIPDSEYPLRINWAGILVDDPGLNGAHSHRDDIVRRVREVLDLIWRDKAHEIEQEACDILGISDLRDYFSRPSGFFQDHLKRYSKSRRKAPIYWPLSTASNSYTVWIYYHRLTDQTLYTVVNKYVEPKIAETERVLRKIEEELAASSGREAVRLSDRLTKARSFLGELRDFRDELLRIAELPCKPNLNDGVIINASPLHNLFRLRSWARDTESIWKKVQKGDYEWAHMAYTIWPDRVREACKKDRSIAIAHGLEELCEVDPPPSKKKGGRRKRKAALQ
jgi:hypothetical protein